MQNESLDEGKIYDVQLEPQTNPKVQSASIYLLINEKYLINHRYYTRFMAEETELWMFGCGLGEQASIEGFGEAFLRYCEHNDPALGRIVITVGVNATSYFPYKGDINLWLAWAYSTPEMLVEDHFKRTTIKPDIIICPSRIIQNIVEKYGLTTIYLPLGTSDVFKPLGLPRKGLGYAGNPVKPAEQYHMMIEPFEKRTDWDWLSKNADDPYLTLKQLNEWYNRKQIVFGMIAGNCINLHLIPNRMYETLASGTPFISGRYDLEDTFNFPYPFMSDSQEETVFWVETILADYPKYLRLFEEYSRNVRKFHTFDNRMETLMEVLKK